MTISTDLCFASVDLGSGGDINSQFETLQSATVKLSKSPDLPITIAAAIAASDVKRPAPELTDVKSAASGGGASDAETAALIAARALPRPATHKSMFKVVVVGTTGVGKTEFCAAVHHGGATPKPPLDTSKYMPSQINDFETVEVMIGPAQWLTSIQLWDTSNVATGMNVGVGCYRACDAAIVCIRHPLADDGVSLRELPITIARMNELRYRDSEASKTATATGDLAAAAAHALAPCPIFVVMLQADLVCSSDPEAAAGYRALSEWEEDRTARPFNASKIHPISVAKASPKLPFELLEHLISYIVL